MTGHTLGWRGEKKRKKCLLQLVTIFHLCPSFLRFPLTSYRFMILVWDGKRTESSSEVDLEARGRETVNYLSFYDWSKSVIWTNSCVIWNYLLLFPSSSFFQWVLIQSQIEKSVVCISPCEVLPCKLSRDGRESFLSLTLNWFSNEGNQGINYCVKHSFPALEIFWQEFLSFVPRCRLHVCPFLPQKKWNGRLNSCCFSARGGRNCQSTRLTFLLSWFSFSIRQSPQNCSW